MLRSILSIITGFLTIAIGMSLCTVLAVKVMLGGVSADSSTEPTPAFLAVNIVYSLAFALLGGYMAGFVAKKYPVRHAGALACMMVFLSVLSLTTPYSLRPLWYSLLIGGLCPIVTVVGGYIREVQTKVRVPAGGTS